MAWVGLIVAAAAAAASAYNTDQTAKKQDQTAAEGIRQQAANQRAANDKINETLQKVKASTPQEATQTAQQQYLKQVQATLGQAQGAVATKGYSQSFDDLAAGAQGDVSGYGQQMAALMGRMDGATNQRNAENILIGNTAAPLGAIGSKIQGDDFLNRLKLSMIQRNPLIDAGAGLARGYASTMGSGGGSGGYSANGTGAVSGLGYTAPATSGGSSWLNAYGAG